LKNRDKVPLFVALETQITETAAMADYILPDTTYLERWDVCVSPPSVASRGIGVRVPAVGGFEPKTGRYFPILPDTMPMEDILIQLAVALGLPGYGPDAPGGVKNASDFYKQAVPVVVESMKQAGLPVPTGNDAAELIFQRGGFFSSEQPKPSVKATLPKGEGYRPPELSGRAAEAPQGEGLFLITYSLPFHRTPRSGINSWLLEVLPENRLLINPQDARRIGIRQRDLLFVESLDGKLAQTCRGHVVPGIRPGVVALARGFGYGRAGASPEEIDGRTNPPEKPRGAGINTAALTQAQPPIRVKVRKA
jgi:anaerobic selenocysteine-containing dehydrogenase